MAINITRAIDSILTGNLVVVLFGQPGSGKSSLAFSASRPLLLDFDLGAQRTVGRKDTVRVNTWSDIADLTAEDLVNHDTIIVDTVGRLLDVLVLDLAKRDPKVLRKTGEITLQGYGQLANAYKAWVKKIQSFGKDLVLISHDKEEKNGDNTYVRLDIAGSTKQEILKSADLLGYMYMSGNIRTLDFNPTESHLGKNTPNFPVLSIPDYSANQSFLSDLIQQSKDIMNAKSELQIKSEQEFNNTLDLINMAENAIMFNSLMNNEVIKKSPPLKQQLVSIAKEKNILFDKEQKCFVDPAINENNDVEE
jgi:hypothetical protein